MGVSNTYFYASYLKISSAFASVKSCTPKASDSNPTILSSSGVAVGANSNDSNDKDKSNDADAGDAL